MGIRFPDFRKKTEEDEPPPFDEDRLLFEILAHGPTRVLVTPNGPGVRPGDMHEYNATYETIFIRKDGWSIGVRREWEEDARRLYTGQWYGYIRLGHETRTIVLMEEYGDDPDRPQKGF